MLTFEQKLEILQSYPELERKDVSLGRVNFHYEDSAYDKKTVVYHLHPNGNGYVYAGLIQGYPVDEKGLVNIRDFPADELRKIVEQSIQSLMPRENAHETAHVPSSNTKQIPIPRSDSPGGIWSNANGELLTLKCEDDLWYIYSGMSLEMVFETRQEAGEYLEEEGFAPQKA